MWHAYTVEEVVLSIPCSFTLPHPALVSYTLSLLPFLFPYGGHHDLVVIVIAPLIPLHLYSLI